MNKMICEQFYYFFNAKKNLKLISIIISDIGVPTHPMYQMLKDVLLVLLHDHVAHSFSCEVLSFKNHKGTLVHNLMDDQDKLMLQIEGLPYHDMLTSKCQLACQERPWQNHHPQSQRTCGRQKSHNGGRIPERTEDSWDLKGHWSSCSCFLYSWRKWKRKEVASFHPQFERTFDHLAGRVSVCLLEEFDWLHCRFQVLELLEP